MLRAFVVFELFITQSRHGLGHRLVIIVKTLLAHVGIFFQRVVFLQPGCRRFDSLIVFRQARVDHALQASIRDAAVGFVTAIFSGARFGFTTFGRRINESAVIHFAGVGQLVVL